MVNSNVSSKAGVKAGFLDRVLEAKSLEVHQSIKKIPERMLREEAESMRPGRRSFFDKLSSSGPHGVNIIAEIKRASPSRGPILPDLDPEALAVKYENGGAAALSVLTERSYFLGCPDDLRRARRAVQIPVLRKDFVISTYQVYESAVMQADCVLLIVRILTEELLRDCLTCCAELGLDALVEVHSEHEVETARRAGARLVGINNRDLSSFQTDIRISTRLSPYLEPDQVAVAESGIKGRGDVEALLRSGIWNFLIGESLVKSPEVEQFLRHLMLPVNPC